MKTLLFAPLNLLIWVHNMLSYAAHLDTYRDCPSAPPYDFSGDIRYFPRR